MERRLQKVKDSLPGYNKRNREENMKRKREGDENTDDPEEKEEEKEEFPYRDYDKDELALLMQQR